MFEQQVAALSDAKQRDASYGPVSCSFSALIMEINIDGKWLRIAHLYAQGMEVVYKTDPRGLPCFLMGKTRPKTLLVT